MTARVSEMSSLENILSPCSLYQQTSPRKGLQMLQTPPNCKLTSATISLLWSLKDYQTHPVAESHGLLSVFTLFKLFSVSLTFALTMKFKFHSQGLHHLAPFGFISSIFLHSLGSSHSSHLPVLPLCRALSYLRIYSTFFPLPGSSPHFSYSNVLLTCFHLS